MKKLIFTIGLTLMVVMASAQLQANGGLDLNNGYFKMKPFSSSYDDGTYARLFYDGHHRLITFWNSIGSSQGYTSIKVQGIVAYGNVGIGSNNPDSKLTVKGKIHCEEVKVDLSVPADYVFEKYYTGKSELNSDYVMPTLEEVAAYTKENNHLPEMPSAQEIKENGLHLKKMTNLLLQKVEELTLYTIEQEKRIKALEAKLAATTKEVEQE